MPAPKLVQQQMDTVRKNNYGVSSGTISITSSDRIPAPLTSNFDVFSVAAYWFDTMRAFFKDAGSRQDTWCSVESENGDGKVWHIVEGFGETTSVDAPYDVNLDVYLALPPFPWLDETRDNNADRFMRGASYNDIGQAALLRAKVKDGSAWDDPQAFVERGWLIGITSSKQDRMDGAGRYNTYIEGMVSYWDTLCDLVVETSRFTLGAPNGGKYGPGDFSARFWHHIILIANYIARNSTVIDSQMGWTDYLSQSFDAVKSAGEKATKVGADAVADTATWAANTAGAALGNAGARFLDGIGVWGIMFVGVLIWAHGGL